MSANDPINPSEPASVSPGPGAIDPDQLKHAFQAFKKRVKLTKLDDESRLGGGRPTTGGRKSEVMGIIPPNQFPREVWKELARQGRIRDMGGGFFSMP